jgi:hypothetical protein
MTNTRFIGQPYRVTDSLEAVYGFKALSLIIHERTGKLSILPAHRQHESFLFSDSSHCRKDRTRKRLWASLSAAKTPQAHDFVECDCGFYSYKTQAEAFEHQLHLRQADQALVVKVALSGKVVVAEHGYRAEKQRVTEIEPNPCFACGQESSWFVGVSDQLLTYQGFQYVKCACEQHSRLSPIRITVDEVIRQASYEDYEPVIVNMKTNKGRING